MKLCPILGRECIKDCCVWFLGVCAIVKLAEKLADSEREEFTIDFAAVREQFREFLIKKGVSQSTINTYISYLDEYLSQPVNSPEQLEDILDEVEDETEGGKLRWFSSALANLLKFYETRFRIPQHIVQQYRAVLKWEKSSTDKAVPSDEELLEAGNYFRRMLTHQEYIVFLLLVVSGLRLKHILEMLKDFNPKKLEVREKIARYSVAGAGKKFAFECYMPSWLAEKLLNVGRFNVDYSSLLDRINYRTKSGKVVSAKYIRKWTNSFLYRQGVSKEVRNFILGRPGEIAKSVEFYHYLDLREEADKAYASVVDELNKIIAPLVENF